MLRRTNAPSRGRDWAFVRYITAKARRGSFSAFARRFISSATNAASSSSSYASWTTMGRPGPFSVQRVFSLRCLLGAMTLWGEARGVEGWVGLAADADVAVTARPLLRQDVLCDVRVLNSSMWMCR